MQKPKQEKQNKIMASFEQFSDSLRSINEEINQIDLKIAASNLPRYDTTRINIVTRLSSLQKKKTDFVTDCKNTDYCHAFLMQCNKKFNRQFQKTESALSTTTEKCLHYAKQIPAKAALNMIREKIEKLSKQPKDKGWNKLISEQLLALLNTKKVVYLVDLDGTLTQVPGNREFNKIAYNDFKLPKILPSKGTQSRLEDKTHKITAYLKTKDGRCMLHQLDQNGLLISPDNIAILLNRACNSDKAIMIVTLNSDYNTDNIICLSIYNALYKQYEKDISQSQRLQEHVEKVSELLFRKFKNLIPIITASEMGPRYDVPTENYDQNGVLIEFTGEYGRKILKKSFLTELKIRLAKNEMLLMVAIDDTVTQWQNLCYKDIDDSFFSTPDRILKVTFAHHNPHRKHSDEVTDFGGSLGAMTYFGESLRALNEFIDAKHDELPEFYSKSTGLDFTLFANTAERWDSKPSEKEAQILDKFILEFRALFVYLHLQIVNEYLVASNADRRFKFAESKIECFKSQAADRFITYALSLKSQCVVAHSYNLQKSKLKNEYIENKTSGEITDLDEKIDTYSSPRFNKSQNL